MGIGTILIGIVIVVTLAVIGFYNGVVRLKVKVDEAWADIDTFLKQRYDMIPNLVSTVKGYMKHEAETLEKVTQLRSAVQNAGSMKERAEADNMLSNTLRSLFAVAENYPDLKANQNFLQLQTDLKAIEDNLQKSRRFYNATVRDFNTKIQVFPGSLIAGIFNFVKREFFEAAGDERENVKVSFEETKGE
ncbi:LemA family protein [Candidatus Dojkabacteria bacterium]|uniref:LemA family protein n=1 Tax=Candidatus Dojkabacteria bacterium TaxID=2099670 RepID=A0A955KW77_9BACT|nr:LemA family protein [Candidatus Dojkabacteria bacterium]MCB9790984.1 LemA family protein [Candidatus Nomurabacteria bacterium]